MKVQILATSLFLTLPLVAMAGGQDNATQTLQQVTVSPESESASPPISCGSQNWPSRARIRSELELPANASVEQMRAAAIRQSRRTCRQDYSHVQWHYLKAGQQVALVVR